MGYRLSNMTDCYQPKMTQYLSVPKAASQKIYVLTGFLQYRIQWRLSISYSGRKVKGTRDMGGDLCQSCHFPYQPLI